MNAEEHRTRDPLTHDAIGAVFEVYQELGFGFLEAVYRRALVIAIADRGHPVETEVCIPVHFRRRPVGDYRADLIVDRRLIVEVKAGEALGSAHRAQLLNYLRATSVEVGLLVNFGYRLTFERLIFTNDRKTGALGR
ncbi:MAG: GxxExxY protein [Gemmatimonadaceae bacterium]